MSDEEPHEFGDEDFSEDESESELELVEESELEEDSDEELESEEDSEEDESESELELVEESEVEEDSDEELESEEDSEEDESGEEEVSFPPKNVREKTPFSSSNNRFKEISIDRLSVLPDSLLIHMLSFLQTSKAVSTCVLSKRWQFLWTELPSLQFINSYKSVEQIRMFLLMIQSALATRTGNNLERIVVNSYYDKSLASDVNVLVELVVKKMVKEVVLFLNYDGDYYTLPEILYSSSSLTRLNLEGCIFNSQKPIMCRSLTTLSLENIEIHEHLIGKILSGCPVLGSLCLGRCWGFNCLEIDSQSVHTLEVDDWDGMDDPLLEISAPYINSLHVSGRKLRLRNIRSVLTAILDFNGYDWDDSLVQLRSYMTDLFEGLQNVKTLHLGSESISAMSKLAATGWQFPQSRHECLIVAARRDEESISSIVALLESSPSLETLDIRGCTDYCWESVKWYPPARVDLNCDLLRLKTVNLIDLASLKLAGEPMLTLAQILLKRATVLEKMVIKEENFSSRQASSSLKISQTLLGLPRSSRNAVVLFG